MDVPSTGLHEGWLQVKLCDSLGLKLGRQELSYDNERLLSKNNWSQQGTSHDAAVLIYKYKSWSVDFGSAFNQSTDNVFGTNYTDKDSIYKYNYKSLNYLWISKKIKSFNVSLMGIADSYQKEGTTNTSYMRVTYGAIVNYKTKKLNITARGFLQNGTLVNGKDINPDYASKKICIKAHYLNMDISYNLNSKFTLLGGFEYISGQNNNNLSTYTAFSTLYGTNHKFNGNMEYFSGAPKSLKFAGLMNPYIDIMLKLNDKISLRADFHYFALDKSNYYIKDSNKKAVAVKASSKYLGTEGDLTCNINFSKEVSLLFGYSYMLSDNTLPQIVGGNKERLGNWAFAQLTVKPSFFKSEKNK